MFGPLMPRPSSKMIREAFYSFKKEAGLGLCWVKGCRRSSKKDLCLCHKHEMQRWRAKHQASAAFHALQSHAKGRGVAFTISVDYFLGLTDSFNYFDPDVNGSAVLTIDRVNAARGYEPGNLRVVSLSLNVAKGNRERYLPEHVREMMERDRRKARDENAASLGLDEPDPF